MAEPKHDLPVIRATSFCCPACGGRREDQLELYQAELFNTHSLRFGPWCTGCGKRVLATADTLDDRASPPRRSPLLLISGSCASGKSTVSYLLAQRYGCVQIDGDWILHLRKAELGRPPEFAEIDGEMLAMAAALTALGRPVAIAQVILPAQMPSGGM